jgi:hypothetical protein
MNVCTNLMNQYSTPLKRGGSAGILPAPYSAPSVCISVLKTQEEEKMPFFVVVLA